jgi:opacity protein-like surface antigen
MKRLLTSVTITLGLWACLSSAAYAQLKDNFELNVFGAGAWYVTKHYSIGFPQVISAAPIPGQMKFDTSWRGGFRIGVATHGHWSEEFFYSYEPNEVHFTRSNAPITTVNLKTQVHNYGVNALYYFNDDDVRVRPFVSIGLGGTLFRLTPEAQAFANSPLGDNLQTAHNSNELAMNYGVGVKTRGTSWLGFRVDGRGFLAKSPNFGLPRESRNPGVSVLPVFGGINSAEVSAGVVFYFFNR